MSWASGLFFGLLSNKTQVKDTPGEAVTKRVNWRKRLAGFFRGGAAASPAGAAVEQNSVAARRAQPSERPRQFSESLESRQFLSSSISFAPAVGYDVPAGPMAVADFNNDGKPDLVAISGGDDVVSVMINKGDGTFQPPQQFYVDQPVSVCVGDFLGNGNQDIAVLSNLNSDINQIAILYGNGNGTFERPARLYNVPYAVTAIASADLAGDGLPDLIFTAISRVIVLPNLGGEKFGKPVPYNAGPGTAGRLIVGDFTGNGLPDVAVVRHGDNVTYAAMLLDQTNAAGQPTGTLGPAEIFAPAGRTLPRGLPAGRKSRSARHELRFPQRGRHPPAGQWQWHLAPAQLFLRRQLYRWRRHRGFHRRWQPRFRHRFLQQRHARLRRQR